jgi:hypothetical protein
MIEYWKVSNGKTVVIIPKSKAKDADAAARIARKENEDYDREVTVVGLGELSQAKLVPFNFELFE